MLGVSRVAVLSTALWAALALLAGGCGDRAPGASGDGSGGGGAGAGDAAGDSAGPALDAAAAETLRARSEAQYNESNYEQAFELLRPLVERPDAALEDVLRGGALLLARDRTEEAGLLAERAAARHPDDPALLFLRANVKRRTLDFAGAAELYRRVLATQPDDIAANWLLAESLDALGETEEPLAIWARIRELGFERADAFYAGAIYRLGGDLIQRGQPQEGLALREESKRLQQETGIKAADVTVAEQRGPGRMAPVRHASLIAGAGGGTPSPARVAPSFRAGPVITLGAPGAASDPSATGAPGPARALLADDLDGDGRIDLVVGGPQGLVVARQGAGGDFVLESVHSGAVSDVAAADLDAGDAGDPSDPDDPKHRLHHPALELLALDDLGDDLGDGAGGEAGGAGGWRLFDQGPQGWRLRVPPADGQAGWRQALPSDFDHDGWLDLVLAGDGGLALLRNIGTLRDATPGLVPATPAAAAALRGARAVLADDFDGTLVDNEADYLVLTDTGLALLSNRRAGEFEDTSAAWNLPPRAALATNDLDLDGRPDLLLLTDAGLAWARNEGGRFAAPVPLDAEAGPGVLADVDLDGFVDRVDVTAAGVRLTRGPLVGRAGAPDALVIAPLPAGVAAEPDGQVAGRRLPVAVADIDGDLDPDVIVAAPDGAHLLLNDGPVGRALPLALAGTKVNARGQGSIVELRAGTLYRRLYWDGRPTLLGLGTAELADVLRITWTNGIIQGLLDRPAGTTALVREPNRLVGSCPFLYTWNGRTFTFVSDVLGATPLGLPLAPGVFVPFDHDEYVKVRGDQLVPDGQGRLLVALTEELREVTYLDRVRLHAIDHPAAVEIEPNEGFNFPPFPEHHVHSFAQVVAPVRAIANVGTRDERDVTERVATVDGRFARPFRPQPAVFNGLAEPWSLELLLAETAEQREALARAPKLRLALTGWFQWSDASVNVAAARHPGVEFEPPLLWVPARPGEAGAVNGWVPTGPPIGFPAGKTKTLVVDLTDLLRRDDPRLRLTTTLQISWDALRLVLDADDAPLRDTALEPLSATLAYRGFSAPLPDPSGELPERFDWNALEAPRWNPHPGRYTRFGEVAPLLGDVDDRYVIFGSGDCVTVGFDASSLPPLPEGWTRDWLLYLDGWAKDRDPNTAAASEVGPLPFHGMSTYPPPASESFPWDETHRAWDREWNTREAALLVPSLANPLTDG